MSKIRQALEYERQLSDAQVRAHVDITELHLRLERELREMAVKYERTITDGQFGQLNLVAEEHRLFHEREHLLYEDAIEKAAASLKASMDALTTDMLRFREEASKWMTVDRFEREHTALEDKVSLAVATLSDKISVEERISTRQGAQEEMLGKLQANNRWLIGVLITVAIFGATTLLHVFNVI